MSIPTATTLPLGEHTPFSSGQWREIETLLRQLDTRQSLWLSGYLAAQPVKHTIAPKASAQPVVWILYGSETGNSEAIATSLSRQLDERKTSHKLISLARVKPRELKRVDFIIVICSTHGDGDPPEPAAQFFETLNSVGDNSLTGKHHAVLALGDSSYEYYCTAGHTLDKTFSALGSKPLIECTECDVDFEATARQWCKQLQNHIPQSSSHLTSTAQQPTSNIYHQPSQELAAEPSATRDNPVTVEVLENICLSAASRAKPIHHLELLLPPGQLHLEPGDAVGIVPHNPPALVAQVLALSGLSGDEPVVLKGRALTVVEAFREHLDLTVAGPALLELWATLSNSQALKDKLGDNKQTQRAYLKTASLLELLASANASVEPQVFIEALKPLQPRLYDAANAMDETSDELNITVKYYRYKLNGHEHPGIASKYLQSLEPGEFIKLYVHPNKRFRLPEQTDAAIIMIAQSTGIAPYRAFIQRLNERTTTAPVWLFLQEQSLEDDFLYQTDWQQAKACGVLSHINTLFTTDTPNTTLADVFLSCADELINWLSKGAHIYIAGEKTALSNIDTDLQNLCDSNGQSIAWDEIKKQKRLHKNLY